MSKAEKRGNKWRIRVYDYTDATGKVHNRSFTADTKAQVEYLAAQFKKSKTEKRRPSTDMTIGDAIDKYISLKPMLSPSTLNDYEKLRKYGFQDMMDVPVRKLDDIIMQEAINRESLRISERTGKQISAKTLSNEWGLLSAALRFVCKETFIITLPKKHKHRKKYPDPEDVLIALQGTDIELPCILALWCTFRMSEIRGLKCSDYDGKYIQIDRVIVDTKKGAVTKDNAKTEASIRVRKVRPYLRYLIESSEAYKHYLETGEDGYLVTMNRGRIYRHWKAIANSLGYDLTFHDLRHLAASIMVIVGVPQRYSMDFGGWETPDIMEDNYQHTLPKEKDYYEDLIGDWFEKNLTKNLPHESANY